MEQIHLLMDCKDRLLVIGIGIIGKHAVSSKSWTSLNQKFPPLGSKSKYWACCLSDNDDNDDDDDNNDEDDDDIGAAGRVVEFERRFLLRASSSSRRRDCRSQHSP